ncbi:MAG TPA: HEAT repeat domain-containing protein [Thermoanaerobaculia bacterium]|nr:HEAT repeat domain-containing protein [Thermoanaerobaculia bacterium]
MRKTILYLCLSAVPVLPGLSFLPWTAMTAAEAQKDELYTEARKDLDAGRWAAAIDKFGRVAAKGGANADAALYWKAYSQKKAGKAADALATLRQLGGSFAKSSWLDDARALEMEIRGESGRHPNPSAEEDEELKLYALNGLMSSDSRRAVPMLVKFLDGHHSQRLKEQALFVLSQSDSPEARKILVDVARGSRYPELQRKAIESIGISGDDEGIQALTEIYSATDKPGVKIAILDAYLVADQTGRVFAAAREEKDPQVRRKAISQLGPMNATQELRQLYRNETSQGLKLMILEGLAVADDADALIEIARDEKEPVLRRKAISGLGINDSPKAAAALKSLYTANADAGVRRAVIEGLFIQDNARALIELFRVEKDPELKREIVQKLGLMDSDEAMEFLAKLFGD